MCSITQHKLSRDEIDALADDIAIAAAHIDAATHTLLTSIRRFDAAGGWAWQGARSCAHWLSWRIGLGLGAAREKVRVAKALAELPHIDAALSRGELSFAKVRALTRVATPENELLLLQYAQSSTGSQLERICRSFRRVTRPTGRAPDDERYVRQRHLENGMVRLEAQLLPDEADLVMKALQEARRAAARIPAETPPPSESTPESPTLVDGLVLTAESFLARGAKTRNGGERNQLFVYLTEERLAGEHAFRATLSDGTILAGPTLLRLACDSGIVIAKVDGADNILDVGRRQRTIPPALRRDSGCATAAAASPAPAPAPIAKRTTSNIGPSAARRCPRLSFHALPNLYPSLLPVCGMARENVGRLTIP